MFALRETVIRTAPHFRASNPVTVRHYGPYTTLDDVKEALKGWCGLLPGEQSREYLIISAEGLALEPPTALDRPPAFGGYSEPAAKRGATGKG